jgi:hypothetical protein
LLERLTRIDPDAGQERVTSDLGPMLLFAGGGRRARDLALKHLDRDSTAPSRWLVVAFYDALYGNDEEALRGLRVVEQLTADLPDDQVWPFGFMAVYAYGRIGRPSDARRLFDRFVAPHLDSGSPSAFARMIAYLGIGDIEHAYESAAQVSRPDMPWPDGSFWLLLNPTADPVLERQEFLDLRRRLGYRSPGAGEDRP